ncbi:hypothetical protein SAMN05421878_10890 [Actinobaculum suis]|uniref:Uncharacterized protein n=1 Tax=Actinobaculum suis TaxID=1657 RepID=A0A1G7CS62_9ACTO|nr:hypothetical protein SAMN05421878_10890 [Actinobaculum suis]
MFTTAIVMLRQLNHAQFRREWIRYMLTNLSTVLRRPQRGRLNHPGKRASQKLCAAGLAVAVASMALVPAAIPQAVAGEESAKASIVNISMGTDSSG